MFLTLWLAGLLAGAPTGCNCGEVPADCSSCLTGFFFFFFLFFLFLASLDSFALQNKTKGINGWRCRPRDCRFCSYGINGFPCGGNNCTACTYGINGWLCQVPASITICTIGFSTNAGWTASARYEIDQQSDVGFAKLFVSSNVPVLGIQLRTASNEVAWQVYPNSTADIGRSISWARLPALSMYAYPSASASLAAFNPSAGRTAPNFLIPVSSGLRLFLQRFDQADYQPAPDAAGNAFVCQVSSGFQADALQAIANGRNF